MYNMTWRYETKDGEVRYLLAPDWELAMWHAAELSGGTENVLDVSLADDQA